ncbi:MAG TPA: hypothetical protein VH855_02615 [Acetobacteraceae bacterium]
MDRKQSPPPTPPAPPERIAILLRVVRILLGYGRHLADTVSYRAAAPGFAAIAACFGTANLALILAHIHRGMLRAMALERVLLARAATGRDVAFAQPRIRTADRPPAPADPTADREAAPPAPRPAAPPPVRSLLGPDHPANFYTPTVEELEAQVRRRPLGRTVVDICLDLAVVPGLCTGEFWNELFDLIRCHGGSVAALVLERWRREQAFHQQQDRHPTPGWTDVNLGRQAIRQLLGFFIGEHPVAPFAVPAPASAAATGPP